MWPFESAKVKRPVVVFHVDQNGLAKGAYFRGDADVLIVDERDPKNRVYRMGQETPDDELRRKIGKHPLGGLLAEPEEDAAEPSLLSRLRWPRWSDVGAGWQAARGAAGWAVKRLREMPPFKVKSRAGA